MKKLNTFELLQSLAKGINKPVMYISWDASTVEWTELFKAAPYLNMDDSGILMQGYAYITFDSEEEMQRAFLLTVGDDGPTKFNPYKGPVRVFACTCGADGKLQSENT